MTAATTWYSPRAGAFWTLSLQGAPESLGAEIPYVKLFGQLNAFVRIGPGWIWASSYRAGAANSFERRLLESDRFQAGGPNSVRGFEQGTLGPDDPILERPIGGAAVLVFNQELRFPITRRLQGVGFYDAGNAFENARDMSLRDLRHSAGLGARIILPFGLLRFDWARILDLQPDETPWRFVFSLGHAF